MPAAAGNPCGVLRRMLQYVSPTLRAPKPVPEFLAVGRRPHCIRRRFTQGRRPDAESVLRVCFAKKMHIYTFSILRNRVFRIKGSDKGVLPFKKVHILKKYTLFIHLAFRRTADLPQFFFYWRKLALHHRFQIKCITAKVVLNKFL